MREIKFRAWNEMNSTMTYFDWDKVQSDQWVAQHLVDLLAGTHTEGFAMQFTGLKDKNGIEIYEGDVVHWGHIVGYTEINPRKAVVEINPDISFKTFNLGDNNHTFKFGSFAYQDTSVALEVIGNIHENPELLEQVT